MKPPESLASRWELFVDDCLIDHKDGISLRLHPPQRQEVVFQVRPPHENACTGCYNLCRDGDRILMYYRGFYPLGEKQGDAAASQTANLATSKDGIHFERPNLGLFEFEGSKENNIVYRSHEAHNFMVFRDLNSAAPPEQRFKAIGGAGTNNLHGFCSHDGIHWKRIQDSPLDITGAFDSVNVAFWDPHTRRYRIFSRYFAKAASGGVRAIQSCSSEDFLHWTKPEPHVYAEGVPMEHFYTNATTPCPGAEHILLSFPMRFHPQRTLSTEGMDYPGTGLSDAVFITSRDGVHWDRTFMEAWYRPGHDRRNWTHRSCTPAVGIIETAPDEWSMYIAEHYGWPDNRLRRVTMRPHGFASAFSGYRGGELLTRPVVCQGEALRLNYATSAAGSIAVEIREETGRPIEGFTLSDSAPLYGDELDRAVSWKGGSLKALSGRPVRFRFVLKDADIYAVRVTG